jgi:ABC-type glycerol-3-phosphate transport system substrate-binding protein
VVEAFDWQAQLNNLYAPGELEDLISSFTPYLTSRHALYAGRRLDCQQCHRSSPMQNKKVPETGFYRGRIAMMVDGEWLARQQALSPEGSQVNYGVAPFPPPAAHPERAGTAVVQGPVVFLPAGATDKEAAAHLLAWMMSPEIVAEEAYTASNLPTSRLAAQDPRFQQTPGFGVFMDLLAHPGAGYIVSTPISPALNEALGQVEEASLHQGGDLLPLLDEVQADLAPRLKEALAYHGRR